MTFLSPDRWLWMLIAIPIIALYIVRPRLRRRNVSSLLFWDQLFDQKRQVSWWRRLRHWLSLLLQLVFVGLLGFALLDPLLSEGRTSNRTVIVIDDSASMKVEAGGQTRFDLAILKAKKVLSSMRAGDQVALVAGGKPASVVTGWTDFPPLVEDALNEMSPRSTPTDLGTARKIAADLVGRENRIGSNAQNPRERIAPKKGVRTLYPKRDLTPFSRILTLSDFAAEQDPDVDTELSVDIQVIPDSAPESSNVGIIQFTARRSFADPIGYSCLIKVLNASDQTTERRLTLTLANPETGEEELVDVVNLKLQPEETFERVFESSSQTGGRLTAILDSSDLLSDDDTATSWVIPRPPVPVIAVADEPNVYLESVLDAVPLVQATFTDAPLRMLFLPFYFSMCFSGKVQTVHPFPF
ncbi:MAG: BatA and WFA domain-containing protein [Planctomycetota bacterium]